MFAKIGTSALFAGFAAGLIAAVLQLIFVQPVLLHAELYEAGELVHFGGTLNAVEQELPGFDAMRDGLSVLFTALIYTGYAFMLVGAMALASDRGHAVTARNGIIWGIAGYIAFHFAPAVSLPPELPGVAAADVVDRQIWWFGTVISAAIAMALIGFGSGWAAWGVAAVLLLAPHVIGAPQPEYFAGPVPPELGGEFAGRALGVGLASWAILGCFAGFFWSRAEAEG
ncbi:cobalt transporter subunit CbtA (proposed) [Thalassovita autumnalis]|uniref:Cobalt transporter subunit CbtA (Proposed) n=1 Tax=Thalassovita autumnalis TaxID=2072972 RepID=A0A0P1G5R5_9RHOB|nr:CbtA family protein [Thalassovita autumnalis]CUH68631.1 cobalt transporter subunit CbtA (proposed) [Thalassovita autumnalis]CUH74113.1 cobalt transporter subunit CbtA (proposed) [Thalassovita autumnalis]